MTGRRLGPVHFDPLKQVKSHGGTLLVAASGGRGEVVSDGGYPMVKVQDGLTSGGLFRFRVTEDERAFTLVTRLCKDKIVN